MPFKNAFVESPLPVKGRRMCGDALRIDGVQPTIELQEVKG
jgi:hypothetical protein